MRTEQTLRLLRTSEAYAQSTVFVLPMRLGKYVFPTKGSTIFVTWKVANLRHDEDLHTFRALVLGCTPDQSSNSEVVANGTLHYFGTENYNAETQVVEFLTYQRFRTENSVKESDKTPTPWSF